MHKGLKWPELNEEPQIRDATAMWGMGNLAFFPLSYFLCSAISMSPF